MTATTASRFGALARAVAERTAEADPVPSSVSPGAGVHRPTAVLAATSEGLLGRITRLEGDLAAARGEKVELETALRRARDAAAKAGAEAEEFAFLDPAVVSDPLPRDRLAGAFDGSEFDLLLADIRDHGQNDAITVRVSEGGYEIAAGRRRLEVCRLLGREVLARVRRLDDAAMLRVQFAENERRQDISALERARWFAAVKQRLNLQAKDIAAQFGIDKSTLSLYLRLARFPEEITARLSDPRRLSVLRARRVMEAIEADPDVLPRILGALDAQATGRDGTLDPDEQLGMLMRAAERRHWAVRSSEPEPTPRRHVVHGGRRVGTLTRNGGQWIFRFATTVRGEVVHALADRLGEMVAEVERAERPADPGDE